MKKAVIFPIILSLIGVFSSADAQAGRILTIGGGISSISHPDALKDYYKRGYNGSVAYGMGLIPGVSLHAMIEYDKFPLGDDMTVLSGFILARLRVMLLAPGSSPYAIGGVGIVRANASDIEVTAENPDDNITIDRKDETATAITLGAGFDFGFAPKMSIFIEGRYVRAFFKDDNFAYIPLKAGVNISL
jgi:opacity protein-like surface antigen